MWATLTNLVSGLVGAVIGAVIAGWYSRKGSLEGARIAAQLAGEQWQLDSRKQEWQELMETLTRCAQQIEAVKSAHVNKVAAWDVVHPAKLEGWRIINDRRSSPRF